MGMRGGMVFPPRPAVQKTEAEEPKAQFVVPFLRSGFGMWLSIVFCGVGAVWFLWLVPPDAALTMGQFALLVIMLRMFYDGASARRDEVYWQKGGDARKEQFHRYRWIYAILAAGCCGGLIWLLGGLPKSWWGLSDPTWEKITSNLLLYTLQWVFALAFIVGGYLLGWFFHKETVKPHPLTGADEVRQTLGLGKLDLEWAKFDAEQEDKPASKPDRTWHIELEEQRHGGNGWLRTWFEIEDVPLDKIALWAANILAVKEPDLKYKKWAGRGALFTRPEYDRLTDGLVKVNMIRKRRGSTGYELLGRGRQVIGQWLQMYREDST